MPTRANKIASFEDYRHKVVGGIANKFAFNPGDSVNVRKAAPTQRTGLTQLPIFQRLRLPLIAAPMLTVSGPELVSAACAAGIVGAFPTLNARSVEELDGWLQTIGTRLEPLESAGPVCANLVMRNPRLRDETELLVRHKVQLVITSVGSPKAILPILKDNGITVFADVASLAHAEKAIESGVDGLVLLSAGAGGQTGWLNGMAFVRAVRQFYHGPMVLAGGISDGVALKAAITLGCDLGYMGTRFIAAEESMATEAYREMLVSSTMDDVLTTTAFTGLDGNYLKPSIIASGIDPDALKDRPNPEEAARLFGAGANGPTRWKTIWSAGHTVSGVLARQSAEEVVAQTEREFRVS